MLNIRKESNKYIKNVRKTIRKTLADGVGVENDTGRLSRSLATNVHRNKATISGMNYALDLRNNRDKNAEKPRASSTTSGFLNEGLDKAEKLYLDDYVESIADVVFEDALEGFDKSESKRNISRIKTYNYEVYKT